MSRLFAFRVATDIVDHGGDAAFTGYDADLQQLVWEGDGEAALGSPLCSGGYYSGRNPCTAGGTACSGPACSKSYLGCYACDYG